MPTFKGMLMSAATGAGLTWFATKVACTFEINLIDEAFRLFIYAEQAQSNDHDEFVAKCSNSNSAKAAIVLGALTAVCAYRLLNHPSQKTESSVPQIQN